MAQLCWQICHHFLPGCLLLEEEKGGYDDDDNDGDDDDDEENAFDQQFWFQLQNLAESPPNTSVCKKNL